MTRLSLVKPTVCPPDGFRYVFPSTGYTVHAWTYSDWVTFARNHLSANHLPVPLDLEETMQDQLCQTLEPGWCNYDDPSRPRPNTSLDWNAVQQGLTTFSNWVKGGLKTVGKDEANRRAKICSRCYLNVNVQGCSACSKALAFITGRHKTQYDSSLKACAACKCFLKAKVHFPLSILDKNLPGAQALYPEFCWLKHNGPNYLPIPD